MVTALLAGHVSQPVSAEAAQKVVMAQPTSTLIFMPVYIARGKGYFKDEGLDLEVIIAGGGSKAAAALIGGSAQFVPGAFAHVVKATAKGQKLVTVAGMMNQIPSNIFMRKEVIKRTGVTSDSSLKKRIQALKGLKIGITSSGSMTDLLARHLLAKGGMNPDSDATIIALGRARASLSAVERRAVDAVVQTSPYLEIMDDRGLGKTIINFTRGDVPELRGYLFSTINTKRSYVEANPGIVLKVVKAIVRAEKYIAENPQGSLAVLRKFFPKTKPAILEQAFKNMSVGMKKDPTINKDEVEKNIKFINIEHKMNGLKPINLTFDDVVTNEFVIKAKKELGLK
jgi:NitT/TauT family transport system substrate-binding protein